MMAINILIYVLFATFAVLGAMVALDEVYTRMKKKKKSAHL